MGKLFKLLSSFVLSHAQNTRTLKFSRNYLDTCLRNSFLIFFFCKNVSKIFIIFDLLKMQLLTILGLSDHRRSWRGRWDLYCFLQCCAENSCTGQSKTSNANKTGSETSDTGLTWKQCLQNNLSFEVFSILLV